MGNWTQGYYKPINESKYIGNVNEILFRSSLEWKTCKWMDCNKNCLQWGLEQIKIPYKFDLDGKIHNYVTDFVCLLIDRQGNEIKCIIEVKDQRETKEPIKPKNKNKRSWTRYNNQRYTYIKNQNKWDAAKKFCDKNNLKFVLLTDKEINNF